ncbi:MAG: hypothetical protein MZV65_42910 [Chromatiales bacterium]|nr:hypothetical protein [Chromatiales bacterium]
MDATLAEWVERDEDRRILAHRTAEELCRVIGGAMLYVPQRQGVERDERDRSIRALFKLRSSPMMYHRLANAYRVTPKPSAES